MTCTGRQVTLRFMVCINIPQSRRPFLTDLGYYLKSAGVFNSLCIICCTASYSSFITLPHYWIKWWMEDDTSRSLYYIIGYILMALAAWISTSGTMWLVHIQHICKPATLTRYLGPHIFSLPPILAKSFTNLSFQPFWGVFVSFSSQTTVTNLDIAHHCHFS